MFQETKIDGIGASSGAIRANDVLLFNGGLQNEKEYAKPAEINETKKERLQETGGAANEAIHL